jgi:hypothetical protein
MVLMHFKMEEYKPVGTQFDVNLKLLRLLDEVFANVQGEMEDFSYKAPIGSLIHAMVGISVDLTFAVSMVSQFMCRVGPLYLMAINRNMRYSRAHWTSSYVSVARFCLEMSL